MSTSARLARVCLLLTPALLAVPWAASHLLPDGQSGLQESFRPLSAPVAEAVAVVRSSDADGDLRVLGTVVDGDGLILTKASEVGDDPVVEWADGRRLAARLVAIEDDWDLALLQVEADDLTAVAWPPAEVDDLQLGSWVLAVGTEDEAMRVGVVGALPRRIPTATPGFLGVFPGDHDRGAQLLEIVPGSSAEVAGFQLDDVIQSINGKRVRSALELVRILRRLDPGDDVEIVYERDGNEQEVVVVLGQKPREEQRSSLGSFHVADLVRVNHRRDRFPAAFRHDAVVPSRSVGGPLVGSDGALAGFNLARLDRAGMLAIPVAEARMVVERLKDEAGL